MKYFAYCRKSSEGEERQALSIPAQIDEIKRLFGDSPDIEIVEWLEEKMSAKAPGRPVYGQMIKRIERGEADGLVAWHPDRLARNSVDGGWIIHLLDRRVLKDLKFVSCMYEQSPQGMFMLQIMFGYSKYYVDNLSENVKRGKRKKIALGWLPGVPPLGYLNDKATRTIICDPKRFDLVRGMWDLVLTGAHSPNQIRRIATEQWSLRSPVRRKSGGGPVALATVYRLFSNPFYAGVLVWNGEWKEGKHAPMVTLEEFNRAQALIGRPGYAKPKTHEFPYTGGLIRCPCGLSVTAEEKIKPSGRRYVYYHCTRRLNPRCAQPPVREDVLDDAIADFLGRIRLPGGTADWFQARMAKSSHELAEVKALQEQSAERSIAAAEEELRVLLDMRTRKIIDDAEFSAKRGQLQSELLQLRKSPSTTTQDDVRLELSSCVTMFRNCALDWFLAGSLAEKRLIVNTVGWNCVLDNKILSIQARIPFELTADDPQFLSLSDRLEHIGTPVRTFSEYEAETNLIISSVRHLEACAKARAEGKPLPVLGKADMKEKRPKQPSVHVARVQAREKSQITRETEAHIS